MAWPSTGSYTAWSKCFKVTSQASKITAVNSWYFLDLSLMPSAFWSAVQSDGDDLRFTEDDGETAVYHKLIYINTGTLAGLVAVAQPHGSSGASSDIDTYCYAGNSGASSTSSSSTFPSSMTCLYMLQEAPTSATAILDWTSNGRNSTSIDGTMTSGDLVTGGPHSGLKCIQFDSNDRATIPSAIFNDCESNNQYTWFGWLKPTYIDASTGAFGSKGVQFTVRQDEPVGGFAVSQRNSANSANFTASAASAFGWKYIHAVYNGSTLKLYIDGAEASSVTATSLQSASVDYWIAHNNVTYWRGDLCQLGFYSSAFSADKIATIYTNETDTAFWSIAEHTGSDNTGTGAITLGATTVSGTGTERENGTGATTLGNVEISGAGTYSIIGSGAIGIASILSSASGTESMSGSGQVSLKAPLVSGGSAYSIVGSGDIDLSVVSVDGYDTGSGETTGWFLFQDAVSNDSQVSLPDVLPWENPENALSDELSESSVCTFSTEVFDERLSVELNITNPVGIDIPSNARVTSIEYKIRKAGGFGGGACYDYTIKPIKDGVVAGNDISKTEQWSYLAAESNYSEGLMGLTWESNDFGSGFGLSIRARIQKEDISFGAYVVTVWGKINYELIEPIEGSGSITLGAVSIESPATLIGSGSITLGNVEAKAAGNSDFCQCCIGYTMSTLLEIRKRLARESGHYELVADYDSGDYADNGMDEYIRGGARYLDDKFQYDKSEAWFYKKLVEGESLVTFQNNRIIKSVWVNKASGDRKKLKRLTLDEIREQYTKDTLAGETNGVPAYWTPAILGLAPEQFTEDEASFVLEGLTDYDLIMFGNHYPHKGIYVMPPCDDTYTVEVLAEWYSAELCDDEDVSFWSQYPEILCMAARREIEIHLHRNTTGAADFERPIIEKLLDLYRNLIAEEVSGPPEDLVMNG